MRCYRSFHNLQSSTMTSERQKVSCFLAKGHNRVHSYPRSRRPEDTRAFAALRMVSSLMLHPKWFQLGTIRRTRMRCASEKRVYVFYIPWSQSEIQAVYKLKLTQPIGGVLAYVPRIRYCRPSSQRDYAH